MDGKGGGEGESDRESLPSALATEHKHIYLTRQLAVSQIQHCLHDPILSDCLIQALHC